MEYILKDGNIVCDGGTYSIEGVEASYGYDIHDVNNVRRMTSLAIESNAPSEINTEVEHQCFNKLCEEGFGEEDECWSEKAIKRIQEFLDVDDGVINII
ncbi:MAG: hypothetical protein HDR51_01295 [Treponema sp.]|nr:hypothetical protein [Treponema sp.]MBD5411373.1 hypothetical protein [Treponema sp.]